MYRTNILWFLRMQSHSRCTAPIFSSGLLHHILITSVALVSFEQKQTWKCTHTHTRTPARAHNTNIPPPASLTVGDTSKSHVHGGGSQGGLGNHGRQRKWLRDKDQTEIWHFILGRSGRHTPFKEYIATEGWRKQRRGKHEVEGFPLRLANISLALGHAAKCQQL